MNTRKLSPIEAFELNMEDAHHLVRLVDGFTNQRRRRARREWREKVGAALDIPKRDWEQLDCVESPDVAVVLKPGSTLTRHHFQDHKPLLRQALVAACAATETYLADKVMVVVRDQTTSMTAASARLQNLPLSVGDWLYIEQNYTYKRSGLHNRIIEPHIREMASTSPTQVGALLSLIGVQKWCDKLDHLRQVPKGETEATLARVTVRRNKIVHTGDRQGRGRAPLGIGEVKADLEAISSIVHAVERMVNET